MSTHAVSSTFGCDGHGIAIGTALDISHAQRCRSSAVDERDVVTDVELLELSGEPDTEGLGERLLARPQADERPLAWSGRHVAA